MLSPTPDSLSLETALPSELRDLVRESGRLLGEVIRRELGEKFYRQVEELRAAMADLRDLPPEKVSENLRHQLSILRKLKAPERRHMAQAFTLFLELMNAGESAYRAHRILEKYGKGVEVHTEHVTAIVYVLTAHPTEARSPQNIEIFRGIQVLLKKALATGGLTKALQEQLTHQLELAWRVFPTRDRAPRVKDEASHIFHLALRPEPLRVLLTASQELAPVYLRTWVGGDKDGHPGVDEGPMKESLQLSRDYLLAFAESLVRDVELTLDLLPGKILQPPLKKAKAALRDLKALRAGDGKRVARARTSFFGLAAAYETAIHAPHPRLQEGKRLFHMFPALVMPLELRESSEILMAKAKAPAKPRAIERMLSTLATLSKGSSPHWYARGLIVSMTESVDHLAAAERMVTKAFGAPVLPVIPLFETGEALRSSVEIVRDALAHPKLGAAARQRWKQFEIMVGYSDSSKQGGVWPSRLGIATAMHALEREGEKAGVPVVFFQGSGGSVDRGGGRIPEQVAWWPRSALSTYKVTIQGEMVERSLSDSVIARGQLERIADSSSKAFAHKASPPSSPALFRLAELVTGLYREKIHDKAFLQLVSAATPYSWLSALKIGSRPARRSKEISVEGLRAIPWVLCWTQTRVLFQTWWGVGTAWRQLSEKEKKELKQAFQDEPVFNSYVKALAFTVAKVELPLWRIYLEAGGMDPALAERFYHSFEQELAGAAEMVRAISGEENPLWYRPWLGASIRLRTPMIHPLNLLQVLAMESDDPVLFRICATGISAGMMTTG